MTYRRKNPQDYRWLAVKCREIADTVSTEQERSSLRAMAKIWDFLADHPEHPLQFDEG
jgi:hypothetical protein